MKTIHPQTHNDLLHVPAPKNYELAMLYPHLFPRLSPLTRAARKAERARGLAAHQQARAEAGL